MFKLGEVEPFLNGVTAVAGDFGEGGVRYKKSASERDYDHYAIGKTISVRGYSDVC